MAKLQVRALLALLGQRFAFTHTESLLTFGESHSRQAVIGDIADLILRIDVVVAGENIAVFLNREPFAAKLRGGAHLRRHAHHLGDGGFEQIDLDAAKVVVHPLFEGGDQKASPIVRVDRPVGDDGV